MPRTKQPSTDDIRERRRKLREDIEGGGLPLACAVRRMREALCMTPARFGQTFKFTARQVWALEAGKSNPHPRHAEPAGKTVRFPRGLRLGKPSSARWA